MRKTFLSLILIGAAAFAAPGRAETVLRVGDQKGNARAVLEAAKALDNLSYRIEWAEFPAAAPLLEAAKVGSIDAGTVGDAPFTFAIAAGAPIKAIVATRAGKEGLALIVAKDSPATGFKDLRGKRIATGKGSIGHQLVLAWLDKEGLKPSDIDLVFLLPADAAIALKTGAIDGWATWDPYTAQLEQNGFRRLVDGNEVTPGIGFFIARDDALADKAKSEALADLATRLAKARAWGIANVDSYAVTWSNLVGLPADVGLVINRRTKAKAVPIDESVIADEQQTIDLYVRHGLIPKRIEARAVLDPRFNAQVEKAEATQ